MTSHSELKRCGWAAQSERPVSTMVNNWEAIGDLSSLVYSSGAIIPRCGLGYAVGQVTLVLGQKDICFNETDFISIKCCFISDMIQFNAWITSHLTELRDNW